MCRLIRHRFDTVLSELGRNTNLYSVGKLLTRSGNVGNLSGVEMWGVVEIMVELTVRSLLLQFALGHLRCYSPNQMPKYWVLISYR